VVVALAVAVHAAAETIHVAAVAVATANFQALIEHTPHARWINISVGRAFFVA
jgi:hypothetical protein